MFEGRERRGSGCGRSAAPRPLGAATVAGWTAMLSRHDRTADGEPVTDAALVDEIRALEELACAARAAQAVLAARFDASQRRAQAALGVKPEHQGRGVAEQIALARRESPHRGRQHLGLAGVLTREMPHALAAFRAGLITEWRATLMARETACLSSADRLAVDREIARDPTAFAALGDRQVVAACQRLAAKLDPASVVARRRRAGSERRVSLRPAPDTMAQLSALLPVAQGVAVYAALTRSADSLRAQGDARSRGQIMADTLVERVTGQSIAPGVPLRVNLVITDRALLAGAHDSAHLVADGLAPEPVPAQFGRDLVLDSLAAAGPSGRCRTQLRRLYAEPRSGELVALESGSRLFPRGLADLIALRDQTCRTPWCDAPIRHADHVVAHADGGATSVANGQGLCESCNHAKQAPGWSARPRPGPRHTVETTTPTGHRYNSTAPPVEPDRLTGVRSPVVQDERRVGARPGPSRLEARFADLVLIA